MFWKYGLILNCSGDPCTQLLTLFPRCRPVLARLGQGQHCRSAGHSSGHCFAVHWCPLVSRVSSPSLCGRRRRWNGGTTPWRLSLPLLGAAWDGLSGLIRGFLRFVYVKRSEKQPYGLSFCLTILLFTNIYTINDGLSGWNISHNLLNENNKNINLIF